MLDVESDLFLGMRKRLLYNFLLFPTVCPVCKVSLPDVFNSFPPTISTVIRQLLCGLDHAGPNLATRVSKAIMLLTRWPGAPHLYAVFLLPQFPGPIFCMARTWLNQGTNLPSPTMRSGTSTSNT